MLVLWCRSRDTIKFHYFIRYFLSLEGDSNWTNIFINTKEVLMICELMWAKKTLQVHAPTHMHNYCRIPQSGFPYFCMLAIIIRRGEEPYTHIMQNHDTYFNVIIITDRQLPHGYATSALLCTCKLQKSNKVSDGVIQTASTLAWFCITVPTFHSQRRRGLAHETKVPMQELQESYAQWGPAYGRDTAVINAYTCRHTYMYM